jgi:hypothetical protein
MEQTIVKLSIALCIIVMELKNHFVLGLFEKYCNFVKYIQKEAPDEVYKLGKLGNFNFFELSASETFSYFQGFIEHIIDVEEVRQPLFTIMELWDPDHPETRPIDKAVQGFFILALSHVLMAINTKPLTEEFTEDVRQTAVQILIPALRYFQDKPDPDFSFKTIQYLNYFCTMMNAFKLSIKPVAPQ